MTERDLEKHPYSADELRVAEWLVNRTGIGAGDDPIGFVLASYEYLHSEYQGLEDYVKAVLEGRNHEQV